MLAALPRLRGHLLRTDDDSLPARVARLTAARATWKISKEEVIDEHLPDTDPAGHRRFRRVEDGHRGGHPALKGDRLGGAPGLRVADARPADRPPPLL